jgi:hypothetical protein
LTVRRILASPELITDLRVTVPLSKCLYDGVSSVGTHEVMVAGNGGEERAEP